LSLGPAAGLPREAADDHGGVADRLDLLEAVAVGELVAHREDPVQQVDDLGRREACRERREPHDVGEEDGHVVEPVGDDGLVTEPRGGPGLCSPESAGRLAAESRTGTREVV
jgi:hypothetical protein